MKKINFFHGFLIFLLILSVGFGSGYLILYYLTPQTQISQLITRALILLVVGIGVGLVCRLTVPVRMWFLKICFGSFGSLLSIAALDWYNPTAFALLRDRTLQIAWWSIGEYTQIGLVLIITAFIALIGKKKPVSVVHKETSKLESQKNVAKRKPASLPVKSVAIKKKRKPIIDLKALTKRKVIRKTGTQKKVITNSSPKQSSQALRVKSTKKSSAKRAPTTRMWSRKKVKLTGTEDHHCPYCLEEVHKNDPRGVMICPDCGTWHHRDCWEITGSCQIAHKHEL
ncbi:MAG TPA: RING finger protein [Anaerolineaceae bacterium]|nr:RING finger protein [Anaerolineaceae bacterium]